MRHVLDASVASKMWLREAGSKKARDFLEANKTRTGNELLAPWHMPAETVSAFMQARVTKNGVSQGLRIETLDKYTQNLMALVRYGIIEVLRPTESIMREAVNIASLDTGGHWWTGVSFGVRYYLSRFSH